MALKLYRNKNPQ